MKHVRSFLWMLLVIALPLVLLSCAKPPEAERDAASKAKEAALSAGADKYAVADLEAAKKLWESAEAKMKDKKYKEAREDYIAAQSAFEKATAGVEAGKKALTDQVSEALASLEATWKNVEARARKLGARLKERDAWARDGKAMSEGFAKLKELIGSDPFQAKTKLDELKATVDHWDNKLKDLEIPPKGPGKAAKEGVPERADAGFRIVRSVVGTGVDNREPVGISETFSESTKEVYCFVEASSIGKDTEISVNWYHGKAELGKTNLPLRMGPRWRTWASKSLRGLEGDWRVEIKDADGRVVKEINFKVE